MLRAFSLHTKSRNRDFYASLRHPETFSAAPNYPFYSPTTILLFITLLLSNILHAQSLIPGYLFTNDGDTIEVELWKEKKKKVERQMNNHLRVTRLLNDELITYTPLDILSFQKGTVTYRSFRHLQSDSSFFARKITSGKIDLYYSNIGLGKYYFKRKNERAFCALDATTKYLVVQEEFLLLHVADGANRSSSNRSSGSPYNQLVNPRIPMIQSNEEAFQRFFIQYFRNNPAMVNKIKHGFYTLNNIESMFRDYNAQ